MRYSRAFLLPLLLILPYAFLNATISPELSIEELTFGSDAVILGTVLSVESRITPDGKSINSYARVKVLDRYKGEISDSVVSIETLGGTVGHTTVYVPGEARLYVGETTVLFIKICKHSESIYFPVGLSQGKFKVGLIQGNSEQGVERDLSGITFSKISFQRPPNTLKDLVDKVQWSIRKERIAK